MSAELEIDMKLTPIKYETREQWLHAAADALRVLFDAAGAGPYPKFRVACGFPKGARGRAVGQTWHPKASGDGTADIFISPELDIPIRILDVLIHELIHTIVGIKVGHRGEFADLAKTMGLQGPATNTEANYRLTKKLKPIVLELGSYPHKALEKLETKKQVARMKKIECPNCGYVARTTQKWLDIGIPTCCCGWKMKVPE